MFPANAFDNLKNEVLTVFPNSYNVSLYLETRSYPGHFEDQRFASGVYRILLVDSEESWRIRIPKRDAS